MASTAIRPPAAPVQKRAKWNTLQILRGSLYVGWALCALYLIAAFTTAAVHRDALRIVCKDTAPNVVAAEHVKFALSDMDADAANELLFEHGEMEDAVEQYEDRREEAVESLIEAAENINYGDTERGPIKTLALSMGTYQGEIQHARDLHERHDPAYVASYLKAAGLMDGNLLPAANALHKANEDQMNLAYSKHESESIETLAFVIFAGLALAGILLCLQIFLFRKTRRVLNPLLLLATVLTVGFLFYTTHVMATEREELKVAKEDAFNSVVALWQARSVAYAANADESRYLLDAPAKRSSHEADFYAKARLLASMPDQVTQIKDSDLAQWMNGKYAAYKEGNSRVEGFSGYLADELGNITFPGERAAALETLRWFAVYVVIDRQIREKEMQGDHAGAIELCLGTKENQSNWAFDKFDKALDETLQINQQEFDKAVKQGDAALEGFDLKAAIVVVLIALLVFGGLAMRIGEYR